MNNHIKNINTFQFEPSEDFESPINCNYYSYYRDSKEVRVNGERQNIGKVLVYHTIKTDEEIKNENDPKMKFQMDSDNDCISSEDEGLDSDSDIENNIELITESDIKDSDSDSDSD